MVNWVTARTRTDLCPEPSSACRERHRRSVAKIEQPIALYRAALEAGAVSAQEPVKKQDADKRGGVRDFELAVRPAFPAPPSLGEEP